MLHSISDSYLHLESLFVSSGPSVQLIDHPTIQLFIGSSAVQPSKRPASQRSEPCERSSHNHDAGAFGKQQMNVDHGHAHLLKIVTNQSLYEIGEKAILCSDHTSVQFRSDRSHAKRVRAIITQPWSSADQQQMNIDRGHSHSYH